MIDENLLLTWGATYRRIGKGEIIFQEGAEAHYYHQLVTGKVKWVNVDDQGLEFIQCIIEKGESFGDLPLFDDQPYVASSIALEASTLIRLRKEVFLRLLAEHPELHFRFTKMMAERLRGKFRFLRDLSCRDPEHKVSSVLQQYKATKTSGRSERCRVYLTRQQIANMTGLRVETVIRTIRHLYEDGKLEIEKGKVFY